MKEESADTAAMTMPRVILETERIAKDFNGVYVLEDIDFQLLTGEIHTLVGENGAGKSTFIKLLSGVHQPTRGRILLDGREVVFSSVRDSERVGIRTVHQEINLVPFFNVFQNIFIGAEETRIPGIGFVNDREMKRRAQAVIAQLGVDLPVTTPAHLLDASMERIVQIAKVLVHSPKVLILDEPTTSLSEGERKTLLSIIARLKQTGMGIIFITHNIDEVMEVSDRVTVFRDGRRIDTVERAGATAAKIVAMMLGHKSFTVYKRGDGSSSADVDLEMRGVTTDKLRNVTLTLHRGEILGIAGVVGAGKTEIAKAIFGLDKVKRGAITLFGRRYAPSPRNAVSHGIALVPEERQAQGLIQNFSVMKNVTLTYLASFARAGVLEAAREIETTEKYIDLMSIKTSGYSQSVKYLSGGNQQKVVLSRWLNGDFQVGLFDEPTKGIDVKAKEDIYALVDQLARQRKSILFLSSYLPELLGICDRILVMHGGRIAGEFDPKSENAKESIMHAMLGGKATE
jgi:ribose transport system ATP-binding protein